MASSRTTTTIAFVCLASAAAWMALAGEAEAQGVGAGPVFALDQDYEVSVGWEASAGPFLLKAAVGGNYRVTGGSETPRMLHYLALEPWLVVGGTVGLAFADEKPRFLYGMWEGFPLPLEGELSGGDNSDDFQPIAWVLTLAFGFHAYGDHYQFYFTPKLWRFATIELNS